MAKGSFWLKLEVECDLSKKAGCVGAWTRPPCGENATPFTAVQFTCKALARFSPFQLLPGPTADTEPPGKEGREGRGGPPSLHTLPQGWRTLWAVASTTEWAWPSLGEVGRAASSRWTWSGPGRVTPSSRALCHCAISRCFQDSDQRSVRLLPPLITLGCSDMGIIREKEGSPGHG